MDEKPIGQVVRVTTDKRGVFIDVKMDKATVDKAIEQLKSQQFLWSFEHGAATPEPPPVDNGGPIIQDLVMEDVGKRKQMGFEKYKKYLRPFDGRDSLWEAYQETLDQAMYLRKKIEEDEILAHRLAKLYAVSISQQVDGNWNFSPYMLGFANGLILAASIMSGGNADFLSEPDEWLEKDNPAYVNQKRMLKND